MNKHQALYKFFSSFGLDAYEQTSVPTGPDAPAFPYLTYEDSSTYGLDQIMLTVSLWYRGDSTRELDLKTIQIAKAIGEAKTLECDEGGIILRRSTAFAQGMSDPDDPLIKRKVLQLDAEFATIY